MTTAEVQWQYGSFTYTSDELGKRVWLTIRPEGFSKLCLLVAYQKQQQVESYMMLKFILMYLWTTATPNPTKECVLFDTSQEIGKNNVAQHKKLSASE